MLPFGAATRAGLYATPRADPSTTNETTSRSFMRGFGRLLQMVGLVLLPLAMLLQFNDSISVGRMLQIVAVGICAFGIGWILMTYRFG